MVIAVLQTKRELLSSLGTGLFEKFGLQLFGEERVGKALVDENVIIVAARNARAQELAGVVAAPGFAVRARDRR